MEVIFSENKLEAVIHLAGEKEREGTFEESLWQYHQDVVNTVILCEVMEKYQVKNLVYSSSKAVYGLSEKMSINEESILGATSPYGRTKQLIEEMLRDLYIVDHEWNVAILRYSQAIGAHQSGRLGQNQYRLLKGDYQAEDRCSPESQLCSRVYDYVHVVDVAVGHLRRLKRFYKGTVSGHIILA